MKLVIATSSSHKIAEIRALLADVPGLQVLGLSDFAPTEEPEEDADVMAGNARIKAEYYARHTGLPTLADDSGIEVDAMGGAPGVRSARWVEGSDRDRTLAILARLEGVPEENRGARYRCTLCFIADASSPSTCIEREGVCEGRIAHEERGANGFGYDPIFEVTAETGAEAQHIGQTMGEVAPEVKAQVSHRARAVRSMAEALRDLASGG